MQEVISEMEQEKATRVLLNKQVSAMEFTIHKLEGEKHTTTMEVQVKATPSESDVGSLKGVLRQKDREIEDLKGKLKALGGDIGEYLGIDVRKICSDTNVRNDDYSKLLLKNKALQDELDALKHPLPAHQKKQPTVTNTEILKKNLTELSSHVDSSQKEVTGLSPQQERNQHIQTMNKEVIISRMEASQTDMEVRPTIEGRSISEGGMVGDASETNRLKQEIAQMREIYESHMKVCTNRATRRSASSSSQVHQDSACVEEMRRKIIILEQTIDELQKNLKYKEKYCEQLQEQIYCLKNNNNNGGDISPVALSKLEDLVDVIMQQKQPTSTTSISTSQSAVFDTEVLKSVVSNSLHAFQDELFSDHESMRQSIKNSTCEILTAVESIQNSRREARTLSRNREQLSARKVNGTVTERRSPYVRSKAGIESIDELEGIRERIDNLQQIIFGRESEVRKIENERDRYSEELIKMVELMKKKDEEHGRVSRLLEVEKQKVDENNSCYRSEMDALKKEQLEIYKEFRDMCDNLKRKDIELLNKTKQNKLLCAEWREKEDNFNEKMLMHEKEQCRLENKLQNVSRDFEEKSQQNNLLLSRLNHSEEQLRTVFDNLSKVEDLMMKAKTDGLYK